MCVSTRAEIANAVLSYLIANPDARDTAEGITEWWLLEHRIEQNLSEVNEVLSDLAAKKLILADKTLNTRVHYRINRRKKKEIRALLERKE